MMKPLGLASLLLFSSALVAPSVARAQSSPDTQGTGAGAGTAGQSAPGDAIQSADAPQEEEAAPDVSIPGGEIVVRGRRGANIVRTAPQVSAVLSSEDIARTGEGDIAGALSRVTGLSVVGNGFVYVRGLGDRYSLALLNGSPLPSPEPLRRSIPLDIFPTNVIASSLVQKSYSPNFSGEFGGGVINLTTKAVPTESFLTISGGVGGDTRTTGQLGYVYAGGGQDWSGFDDGTRDLPPALASFLSSGQRINDVPLSQRQLIAGQLVNANNALLQRNREIPINWSAGATAGTSITLGDDSRLGIIATASYSNKWRTRDTTQQATDSSDLSTKRFDFQRVITDDHIVANALLGFGFEFGDNKIRLTNLYIRDTLKQARLANGLDFTSGSRRRMIQDTAWYERQLINSQIVGEFKFGDMSVDVRGSYANSQREAPSEISIGYVLFQTGPYAGNYLNRLNSGLGSADASYSDLNEDLWSGGVDFSYRFSPEVTMSAGYAYSNTTRTSSRREFQYIAPSTLPEGVSFLRPDLLLGGAIIQAFGVDLVETTETDPAFRAALDNHAFYLRGRFQFTDSIGLDTGVRYEVAEQTVAPIQVFNVPSNSGASNRLDNRYWLPSATLTWELTTGLQLRVSGSKTISRPQFRELLFQQYYDPETNRQFRGNPALQDSQLYNADARIEWYFARDQRVSVAGFYKRIDNPIEAFGSFIGEDPITSFANAPRGTLYGAEVEAQKFFPLWGSRRAVLIANYTYTKSKVSVKAGDTTSIFTGSLASPVQPASNYFLDGRPLTGQSDHLGNLEVGIEDEDHLSQFTLLFKYASKRLTSRGPGLLPDIYEYPGIQLDFVARQGVRVAGVEFDVKLEVRNITGTKYQEYQQSGANRIYYNLYNVGTSGSVGVALNF
jgi:outer membrane receptor protein involved in Fe transport